MPQLRIRTQLYLGYLAVIVVLLVPLVVLVMYIGRTERLFAGSTRHHELIKQVQMLTASSQRSAYDVLAYTAGQSGRRSAYEQQQQRFNTDLGEIEAIARFLTPEQQILVSELSDHQAEVATQASLVFAAADRHRAANNTQTLDALQKQIALFDSMNAALDEQVTALSASLQTVVKAEMTTMQVQIATAATIALIATVAAGVFALIISQIVTSHIVPPIVKLTRTAREVAQGDLTQQANIRSNNEIGELGAIFDQMTMRLSLSIKGLEAGIHQATAARESAEHADKTKGAFIASMSHELRTPLNAIINFTRFVAEGDMGEINSQQKELLVQVIASGRHLLNLINDILDMSKIEAGSMRLNVTDGIDVRELLHHLAGMTRGLVEKKPVEIREAYPDELPLIQADRQRLYQSLLNIGSNAAKFTDEGAITIGAQASEGMLEISISDTGSGIASDEISGIFEVFQQTERGMKEGRGTGLGMPIAKNLIEAHGGSIRVESVLGQGTVFYIRLPVHAAASPTARPT